MTDLTEPRASTTQPASRSAWVQRSRETFEHFVFGPDQHVFLEGIKGNMMKSNKQRRQEIKLRRIQRAQRQARRATARPVDRPIGATTVTPALLRPTTSYGVPDFVRRGYYQDLPFAARIAVRRKSGRRNGSGGGTKSPRAMWTTATRCRACREQGTDPQDGSPANTSGGIGGEAGTSAMRTADSIAYPISRALTGAGRRCRSKSDECRILQDVVRIMVMNMELAAPAPRRTG